MHPALDQLAQELRAASARAHDLAASVNEQQWLAPAPGGGWSIDQCIAHLTLTNERYLPILVEAADAAPAYDDDGTEPPPMQSDLAGRLLTWMMEPPVRLKLPTGGAFVPSDTGFKAGTLAAFDASQAAMQAQLAAMDGLDLTRIRVTSPFNARMRYSAYSALRILLAHERRHLWQAERVRKRLAD